MAFYAGRIVREPAGLPALARAVRVAGRVEPLFVETIAEMPAALTETMFMMIPIWSLRFMTMLASQPRMPPTTSQRMKVI